MYVVGRPFRSHLGEHAIGDELEDHVVESWRTYRSLVSSRILFKVASKEEYKTLPPHLRALSDRASRLISVSGKARGSDDWEKPQIVQEAEGHRDAILRHKLKGNESHVERIERLRERKKERNREPVKVPERKVRVDEMKSKSQEEGTDFDPEKIRIMKLEELRDMAIERGLPKSGTKPEVAQRIIDDEIEKSKK